MYWEIIREAALKGLCLELYYTNKKGERKRYELIPVSIRGAKNNSILFYAYDIKDEKVKAYSFGNFHTITVMPQKKWAGKEQEISYPIEVAWPEVKNPKGLSIRPI